MNARELGRQAAVLHLKLAGLDATPGTVAAEPAGLKAPPSPTGGAAVAGNFGAKPAVSPIASGYQSSAQKTEAQNAEPLKTYPEYRQPTTPSAAGTAYLQPNPTGLQASTDGGGISGMLGGLAGQLTPQTLASILGNPALQSITKPLMGIGGLPLLTAGADMALHGGSNMKTLMRGPIGYGNRTVA